MARTTGLILLVGGNSTYTRWAENMITSFRHWSPDVPIRVVTTSPRNWMPGFPIDFEQVEMKPEHYTDSQGNFAPGKAKLHLDLYTDFDLTLYADIDGVLTQPIEPLIELIGDRPFASQVESWSNETGTEWPCQWLSFWEVKAEFKLPKKFRLPELNSSFLAWDKSPAADLAWANARNNYREYLITGNWGYSFPDELAFNVALAQSEVDPDLGRRIITFDTKKRLLPEIQAEAFFVGCYGQYMSSHKRTYDAYDLVCRVASRSVRSNNSPAKAHQLMGAKHVKNKPKKKPIDYRYQGYEDVPAALDLKQFPKFPAGAAAVQPFTNGFNGSIVGSTYVTRLDRQPWHHDRKLAKMSFDGIKLGQPEIIPFATGNTHAEDPCCFELDGRPACLFNDGQTMWFGWIDTGECHLMTPPKSEFDDHDGREKNWTPFVHSGKLHVIYSPGHVVQYADLKNPSKEWKTEAPQFAYGAIRGGTQAVKHNGKLYTIFHTRYRIMGMSLYTAGLLELEAKAPFKALRITPEPIFKATFHPAGDIPDSAVKAKRQVTFVTFPRHLDIKDGVATILAGWQDVTDQYIQIKWEELEGLLQDVKSS